MPVICVTELKSTCPIVLKKSYMAYVPAILMTVGIAVVSLWEAPHLPREVAMHDKMMHGLMYTVLAVSWMVPVVKSQITNHKSQITNYLIVVFGVTAYGALMEVLQRYCMLTRSGEMADLLADFIGALIGVIIVGIYFYCRHIVITSSRHHENE